LEVRCSLPGRFPDIERKTTTEWREKRRGKKESVFREKVSSNSIFRKRVWKKATGVTTPIRKV